jgi:LysM repeat protein
MSVVIRRIDDMAALFQPNPFDPSHIGDADHRPASLRRPQLTVLEGGRSAARRRRRVFVMRRAAVLALAVVMVVAVGSAVSTSPATASGDAGASGAAPTAASVAAPADYVVRPGDTLWRIAASLHLGGDIRDTVDELARANGGAAIAAGQRLVIPASLRG